MIMIIIIIIIIIIILLRSCTMLPVSLAILPITVLSPVLTTMPVQAPEG